MGAKYKKMGVDGKAECCHHTLLKVEAKPVINSGVIGNERSSIMKIISHEVG